MSPKTDNPPGGPPPSHASPATTGRPPWRFPEYYGWRIVASVWATFLVGFGVIYYSFGVFFVRWEAEFGWSRTVIAGVQTLVNLTVALLGPLFGVLSDRVGTRQLVMAGSIVMGAGVALAGLVQAPWQLYLCFLVAALGLSACGHVVLISLVSRWFNRRRGLALGLAETGMGAGGIIMVPVSSALVAGLEWRWAIAALGALIWLVNVPLAALVMRTTPGVADQQFPEATAAPAEEASTGARRRQTHPGGGLSVGQAVRTWQLWRLIAALALAGMASSAQLGHLLPFMKDLRLSSGLAAGLFSLASAALLAGKLFFGYVSDRASPKLALLVAIAIGVAAALVQMALLAWTAPVLMAILAAALVGAVAGAFTVIMPTLIGALFGTRRLGTLLGLVFLFTMSGMALGPLVAGRMFDATGSYQSFFVLALALYGLAAIAAAVLRPRSASAGPSAARSSAS